MPPLLSQEQFASELLKRKRSIVFFYVIGASSFTLTCICTKYVCFQNKKCMLYFNKLLYYCTKSKCGLLLSVIVHKVLFQSYKYVLSNLFLWLMKLANCSLKQYRDLGENMTGDQKSYRIPAMVDVYQNILEQTLHVDDILLSLKVFIGKSIQRFRISFTQMFT